MTQQSFRARHHKKQQLFALVAELHRTGITSATAIAKLLRVSDTYVRRVIRDLGLQLPQDRLGLLQIIAPELRDRILEFGNRHKNPST